MLHCRLFQFCYCNVNFTSVARRHKLISDYTANNIKLMMEDFGFTNFEVIKLMRMKNSIKLIEPSQLKESYDICKNLGFTKNDLLKFPSLLISYPCQKINHYNALLDTGCNPIDAYLLSSASMFLRRKISFFKQSGYLQENINVADRLLGVLDPPIPKPTGLMKDLKTLDEMIWSEIHKIILVAWLKRRLNATDDDLIKLLRIHRMIKNKSFRTINENITLAESIGLSNEKILKCGYLLNNHPEYPKTMLRDYPNFAGIDIARAYKVNPKMMMVNPRKIMEIYGILKEFNISDKSIQQKPDVFTISPHTLRLRLQEIKSTPEFRVLFHDSRMLELVTHHTKIKTRWSHIKRLKLQCSSLRSLKAIDSKILEDHISEGKDFIRPQNAVSFISQILEGKLADIREKITKHPYYFHVSYLDIERTVNFLIKLGYTKEHIARCPMLVLYPRSKIIKARSELKQKATFRFRMLHPYKQLHLTLYQIEKDHHFTGNGIWKTDNDQFDSDDSEERT